MKKSALLQFAVVRGIIFDACVFFEEERAFSIKSNLLGIYGYMAVYGIGFFFNEKKKVLSREISSSAITVIFPCTGVFSEGSMYILSLKVVFGFISFSME